VNLMKVVMMMVMDILMQIKKFLEMKVVLFKYFLIPIKEEI
jgi:hypothetical protein